MLNNNADTVELKNEIRSFIATSGYVEESSITDETLVFSEGIIESIGFVQLVVFLEEKFGVQSNDKDLVEENFESVNAIADFVMKKLNPS
jgi:acyl carrier protein